MSDSMGLCPTCGRIVRGYELTATPPESTTRYGPSSGQHGELDARSSILTLVPCGCHILGDVGPTIRQLLAAAAGRDTPG